MAGGDDSEGDAGSSFADLVSDDTRKLDKRRTRIVPQNKTPRPAARAALCRSSGSGKRNATF